MDDRAAAGRGLKASEYFLQHRDFDGCRKYALRAQQSSPHLPAIPQLLAVADVLIAAATLIAGTQPDWYSILQVIRFSQDTQLLTDKFNNLLFLLNPNNNKFPFAGEAFELVCNAWSVLSNPVKRCHFDNFLRNSESKNCTDDFASNGEQYQKSNENETFWTICPYCYFVYQFSRVYEDCCLKCQNEKCGRGFHAVEIASPPMEVVENGQYKCLGFHPLGFGGGGGGKDFSSWTPFVPISVESSSSPQMEVKKNKSKPKGDNHNVGESYYLVEITDDSGDNSEGEIVSRNANTMQAEKMKQRSDEVPDIEKPVMKRKKKSVAKATKKLMGRGTRIEKHKNVAHSGEELDLNSEASEDDQDFAHSVDDFIVGGVEFFEGDGDVFVDLHEEGF